jgi:hypothetical protein
MVESRLRYHVECFGHIGSRKWLNQGCTRILWSSRYAEMVESRVR